MARLTPITSKNQVAAKDQAIVDSIVASRGALQGPFTMFLHSPELAGRLAHLGAYVRFEGSLDMRVRVLAAMTVARELDAVYVWGAQTGGARRLGVPESTITAIRENHSRGIPSEDAQIVEFTRQLMRQHRVDEPTVKALIGRFGNAKVAVDLTGCNTISLFGVQGFGKSYTLGVIAEMATTPVNPPGTVLWSMSPQATTVPSDLSARL